MSAAARPRPGFFALDLLDDRYPMLHGLRVLAILSVIQIHVTWDFHNPVDLGLPEWFVDRSYAIFFGMDCFFVLSGFLIGSILLRSIDTSGTQQIRRFYLRRIFRTFPSYYVVLTVLALGMHLNSNQREHLWYEYVYLTNFVPVVGRNQLVMIWGWSLSLEEQFYLAVPLLFVALRKLGSDRMRIAFLAALMALALVVRLVIYVRGIPWEEGGDLHEELYFRTWTRFDAIVAGVMLAVAEARYHDRIRAWLQHPAHRAMLAVPALGCLWILCVPTVFGDEYEDLTHVFAWGSLTSVMYLAAVPLLLHGTGPITRFLSWPIWRRVATLGYGVYLVHIPILDHVIVPHVRAWLDEGVPLSVLWPATFAATIVLAFGVGYLMHILIEKPSLRIREWLAA